MSKPTTPRASDRFINQAGAVQMSSTVTSTTTTSVISAISTSAAADSALHTQPISAHVDTKNLLPAPTANSSSSSSSSGGNLVAPSSSSFSSSSLSASSSAPLPLSARSLAGGISSVSALLDTDVLRRYLAAFHDAGFDDFEFILSMDLEGWENMLEIIAAYALHSGIEMKSAHTLMIIQRLKAEKIRRAQLVAAKEGDKLLEKDRAIMAGGGGAHVIHLGDTAAGSARLATGDGVGASTVGLAPHRRKRSEDTLDASGVPSLDTDSLASRISILLDGIRDLFNRHHFLCVAASILLFVISTLLFVLYSEYYNSSGSSSSVSSSSSSGQVGSSSSDSSRAAAWRLVFALSITGFTLGGLLCCCGSFILFRASQQGVDIGCPNTCFEKVSENCGSACESISDAGKSLLCCSAGSCTCCAGDRNALSCCESCTENCPEFHCNCENCCSCESCDGVCDECCQCCQDFECNAKDCIPSCDCDCCPNCDDCGAACDTCIKILCCRCKIQV